MGRQARATRVALRGSLGVLVIVCTLGLALVLVGDALVRGAVVLALRGTCVIALVVWLEWWLLASPALVVTRRGLQVVSPLRRRALGWAAVARIEPRFVPTIVTDDGERIRAIGAPTAGIDRALGTGQLDVPAHQPASVLVAAARRLLEDAPEPHPIDVETAWRWREALVALGLVALAALALTLPG